MPTWTIEQLNAYEARNAPKQTAPADACDCEADLHTRILYECIGRGWLAFHGSMAHRTFRTGGEPDFVILTDSGVLLVECKSATGKLSPEQMQVAAWAKRLGHTVHVVRSFTQFLTLCDSI